MLKNKNVLWGKKIEKPKSTFYVGSNNRLIGHFPEPYKFHEAGAGSTLWYIFQSECVNLAPKIRLLGVIYLVNKFQNPVPFYRLI